MDSTLHVTTANLETLVAVSSMNMPISLRVDQWLTDISQSEEGVVLCSDPIPTFSLASSSHTYSVLKTWDIPPPSPTVVSKFLDIVPAHPFDILSHLASEPLNLRSLMQP